MKKKSVKLSLNKLTISKLDNLISIKGGSIACGHLPLNITPITAICPTVSCTQNTITAPMEENEGDIDFETSLFDVGN